jgi:hypothetical protein
MTHKVILLELNEVPYRVIDAYCIRRPRSQLASLIKKSRQFETYTEDKLALDPWISWPTFHRGVNDEVHSILHLGQVLSDADAKFPPIWRLIKQGGKRVGVFGSLHSSNIPGNVQEYSFYVPDYFDAESFAHPDSLRPFQELNLAMTRQSARNVTRKIPLVAVAKLIAMAPRIGLRAATLASSLAQLATEVIKPRLRIRRRSYQPLLMADLFLRQLKDRSPDFATFYTNHVAAAMHRYWGAAFPADYAKPLDPKWVGQYREEIYFAMDKFDDILTRIVAYVDSHPEYTLLIASSMGQAAIPAETTYRFLTIVDLGKFMSAMGVPLGKWEARPAMVPCQCVVVEDAFRSELLGNLERLRIDGVANVPDPRPIGPMSYDERERGFFQFFVQFDNYDGAGSASLGERHMPVEDIGFGFMAHEDGVNCTAQHIPGGSLIVYRKGLAQGALTLRTKISTLDVAPSLLKAFGLEQPGYMPGTPSIEFN